ncbi:type I-F CRISPR-associated endoribonuclease Cas6/Csy4 [Salinisphaera aquimarina]|uniref:Type I-F CRISPR-associated endoribonuclease Cas6/Csy4 n=1 Tax=Salinisphaera aquimarina TaxID=2094031 RepID=A0ABV7EPR6_9GAMM
MTTHYLDIQLRPDPEFPAGQLMGALFSKLHRALVSHEADDIGVSFPEHRLRPREIGACLRLHGTESRLNELMTQSWLSGMRDHVDVNAVSAVPTQAKHRFVRRRQFKTNAERLRRRRMRRHAESEQTVLERIPDSVEQRVSLPFVQLRSASTGQRFSLFVEHTDPQTQPRDGHFNTYGLSNDATVPWF